MSDLYSHDIYPVLKEATPEAVVIYCGDPRFQAAFRKFIDERHTQITIEPV